MRRSTSTSITRLRRIVLVGTAAALIAPTVALAAESDPQSGVGGFSPPPGATAPPVFSPPAGATLPPGWVLPGATDSPALTPPSEGTPATEFSPPPGATTTVFAPSAPADPVPVAAGNDGFDIGDAGIGAAALAGTVALLLVAAAFVVGRRRRLGAFHS